MQKTGYEKFHKIKFNKKRGSKLTKRTCIECGDIYFSKFPSVQIRCGLQREKTGCSYKHYLKKQQEYNRRPDRREYQRRKYWRLKKENPEYLRAKSRKWNKNHAGKSREWWRKNRSPNPEKYGYPPLNAKHTPIGVRFGRGLILQFPTPPTVEWLGGRQNASPVVPLTRFFNIVRRGLIPPLNPPLLYYMIP